MDPFLLLYQCNTDIFYQLSMGLPLLDLIRLCRVNRFLYTKLYQGESRNIWAMFWYRDFSSRIRVGSIATIRHDYIRLCRRLFRLHPKQRSAFAARKGLEIKMSQLIKGPIEQHSWEFISAVRKGHLEVIDVLLSLGFDLHYDNEYAIRYATMCGHYELVKYLLNKGVDPYVNFCEALVDAIKHNQVDCVRLLLEFGLQTPLEQHLITAIQSGFVEMAHLLILFGADINYDNSLALLHAIRYCCSYYGADASYLSLHYRPCIYDCLPLDVRHNYYQGRISIQHLALLEYLIMNIDNISPCYDEPLRYAARHGNAYIVRLLLERGAIANALDNEALRYAGHRGHHDVVGILLLYGADPSYLGNNRNEIQLVMCNCQGLYMPPR
jgi:ankyrin repeat protein